MKDAFAPGPLDESMSSLGPIFDIALKDITVQICGTAGNFQDGTEGSVCE